MEAWEKLYERLVTPWSEQVSGPGETVSWTRFARQGMPARWGTSFSARYARDFGLGSLWSTIGSRLSVPLAGSPFSSYQGVDIASLASYSPPGGSSQVPSTGDNPAGDAAPASLGGDWAPVDRWNAHVQVAAKQAGVPANLLKAIMRLESGGNPNVVSPAGAIGLMQVMPYHFKPGQNPYDPQTNISVAAQLLRSLYDRYGSWEAATKAYFGGTPDATGADYYGTTTTTYWSRVKSYWDQLNSASPSTAAGNSSQAAANQVIQKAMEYVGVVPYVWGGIPGKGVDPRKTGWDCSGFTYWLDQNYGSGQLPMGSHYQYDWGKKQGKLFTDLSQLQPGDLVFFDTGFRGGAGSHLNNASHVAVYAGNGKIIHATNPSQGTVISDLNSYLSTYTFLGAMHMPWSGGGTAALAAPGRSTPRVISGWITSPLWRS